MWDHKLAGNPVAVWRNGGVEWIRPEEISDPPGRIQRIGPAPPRADAAAEPPRATTMTEASDSAPTPAERVEDVARILRALKLAVREALQRHKQAGNPVAVWRNDRVEWIPPEEIPTWPDDASE